jgi:Lrp/AsnC family transcriptional regulator for asnA, asnC and gidA
MKKIGYDWGSFTGISLNKDEDSSRIIGLKKNTEVTECYYIQVLTPCISRSLPEITNTKNYFMKNRCNPLIKTDSMIELGCAFKRNLT